LAKTKLSYNPLDMMMSGDDASTNAPVTELSPKSIAANPYQPRRSNDDEAQRELVATIEEGGIHEPLIVRPLSDGRYQLVAGGRRLAAALELGLRRVPVIVREYSDEQAEQVALIENLQRANLRFDDEAVALLKLKQRYKLSNEAIGKSIGKSADYVELRIAAAENPDVLTMYMNHEIEQNQIRAAVKAIHQHKQNPKASDFTSNESSLDTEPHTHLARRPHDPVRVFSATERKLQRIEASWGRMDADEQDSYRARQARLIEAVLRTAVVTGVRMQDIRVEGIKLEVIDQ
jgi:ParB/RepB/Spo0J family partition protein